MTTVIGLYGTKYQIDSKPFKSGGEGDIYHILNIKNKSIAKIYHGDKPNLDLENKIKFMVNNPPNAKVLDQVAWPLDVLYDSKKQFCGFVMPGLNINAELRDIYQYPPRDSFSLKQKVIIAENICAVITAIHKADFIFGDFNPSNIGVNTNTGKVAFLDTDTYHVTDTFSNEVYRCNVCADGYAAPELLEACADYAAKHPEDSKELYAKVPLPTFTKETDNFALAIHIFKLLMNSFTPFSGIIETISPSKASPSIGNTAIRKNEYCFRPGYKPLSVAIPPLDVLPKEIADLFTRAFLVIDEIKPKQRPSSVEWFDALNRYENNMVDCKENALHQYDKKNKTCPFCEADKRYEAETGQIIYKQRHISQKTFYINNKLPLDSDTNGITLVKEALTGVDYNGIKWTYTGSIANECFHGHGKLEWDNGNKYDGEFHFGNRTGRGTYKWANGDRYTGDWLNNRCTGRGTFKWANGTQYFGEWSNDLRNGKGLFKMENGDQYDGDWIDDVRTGKGTYRWANGDIYNGDFKDNEITGNGKKIWMDGSSYIGEWYNGARNGRGFIKWTNGDQYDGDWLDDIRTGIGTYKWADGSVYTGDFIHDSCTGRGQKTWANGDQYYGQWKDDNRHGKGEMVWKSSGDWYDGDWVNDVCIGRGTYRWANGDQYDGNWVNGERTGKGIFKWADGTVYIGDLINGKFTGKGKKIWTDGSYYKGYWKDGKRHGKGKLKCANGFIQKGIWIDDVYQEKVEKLKRVL
ncbi:MAG: hypothetical protein FWC47_10120 [Oscillospiraceae bacterium]|nr:hypothetical protein [Oscillospiraceae bacterium]